MFPVCSLPSQPRGYSIIYSLVMTASHRWLGLSTPLTNMSSQVLLSLCFQLNLPKIKYPSTRTQIPTLLKTKAITVLKISLNLCQTVFPGGARAWPDRGLRRLLSDLMETTSCSSSSLRSADLPQTLTKSTTLSQVSSWEYYLLPSPSRPIKNFEKII